MWWSYHHWFLSFIISYYCSILVTRLYTAYSVHYWATIQNVVFVHDMIWAMRVLRFHISVFRLPLAFTVNCSLLLLARPDYRTTWCLLNPLLFFNGPKSKPDVQSVQAIQTNCHAEPTSSFKQVHFWITQLKFRKEKMFDIWFAVRNTTTLIANVCEVQQLLPLFTINYINIKYII